MEVILTHENADFDAIASLLGAGKLFPTAVPVLPRRVNRNCRAFLSLYGGALPFVEPDALPRRRKIVRAILVDTQGLTTLKGMKRHLAVDIIDHHPLNRDLPPGWTFSGEPLGATTTLLTEEISARTIELTSVEATLLLLGIYEDTGSLSYQNTTSRDVRAAAWLLDRGANLAVVNEFLHRPLAPAQQELYERLLEGLETHEIAGHTIIIAAAEVQEYAEEVSTLAHKLRDILDSAALFVLVALGKRVQLVARSDSDAIDVSPIAAHFGGGGHRRAAAALIHNRSLEEVRRELLALLPQTVRPGVTVARLMSRGVQMLSPEDTVAEAAERMRRTGHEGYPVVAEGRVVGLLTRRAVDRALQFEMASVPVTQVMKAGSVTVTPEDSVEHLQRLMLESGWGQIPVVEGGRVVGVVTRTDLITLWGMPDTPPRRHEVAALLKRGLPAQTLALVRRISRTAHEMGYVPYFVGGLVRDLLLGHSVVDVDIVVEGDGIALARRLAAEMGGRVRTHRRFGTAKWLLTPLVWRRALGDDEPRSDSALPSSVDFATARTEFYTHPTALPQVERSSIKQDLHRRDFTINTLAIRLDPARWGELLDFYGGEADLRSGVIRVLHSLSFVDDPTRMLRAARLESRLGFHLDPRSEQLIADALPLLKRVSGDRIRHEMELIFREPEPERAICRLEELRVLEHIHPHLRCDEWLCRKYRLLRRSREASPGLVDWGLTDDDLPFLYLALLVYRLAAEDLAQLLERLNEPRAGREPLLLLPELKRALPQLGKARRAGTADRILRPYPDRVLAVAWLATGRRRIRNRLLRYQKDWRPVRPELTGNDLKGMGLQPGPLFRRLLSALREARLDGLVHTRADEEELVRSLLAEWGES